MQLVSCRPVCLHQHWDTWFPICWCPAANQYISAGTRGRGHICMLQARFLWFYCTAPSKWYTCLVWHAVLLLFWVDISRPFPSAILVDFWLKSFSLQSSFVIFQALAILFPEPSFPKICRGLMTSLRRTLHLHFKNQTVIKVFCFNQEDHFHKNSPGESVVVYKLA